MVTIEQEYEELKKLFPGTKEGRLYKLAAEHCYLAWAKERDQNITFMDYLDSLMNRIKSKISQQKGN